MAESGDDIVLYTWLASALEGDSTVITSSRRLARELHAEHDRQQLASGQKAWATPHIVFWRDFLARVFESNPSAESPHAIDPNASTIVWERCVSRHLDVPLASPGSVLRQAKKAWQRLLEWQVPLKEVQRQSRSSDERAFAKAALSYNNLLAENMWLDAEQAADQAIGLIQSGSVGVARQITHAGFDAISPVVESLFSALGSTGSEVIAAPVRPPADGLTSSSYLTSAAECRAAGAWARNLLLLQPAAKIAIVATDLGTNSGTVARLVREGLVPGWQTGGDTYDQAVNVSFGRKLSEFPVIHAALLCIQWTHRGLTSGDVSMLLRSPFLGGGDLGGRSQLELRLRHLPDRKWTAAALHDALANDKNGPDALMWLSGVQKLASLQSLANKKCSPADWAERLDEILTGIGWPGDVSLKSEEFQLVNRWRSLLNELAVLGTVIPQVSFAGAIRHLKGLASDTVYQPENASGLVNLLGTLEAAGMEFDHLWVTGMDSSRWPLFSRPLTLVSRELQREFGMPDATPLDSLEYSRRVLRRLTCSASAVHFSWAHAEDDTAQFPSPLLDELTIDKERNYEDPYWYADALLGEANTQLPGDDPLPSIAGVERVLGGAYTVQRQTIEPFAAFAYGRLGIKEMRQFESGLSPSLRGSLLHETLHQLLQEKPAQQDICAWTESETTKRIDVAIERAFSRELRHADGVLRRLFAMERTRLQALLGTFISSEKSRAPFVVAHVEEFIEFEYAGIQLNLRVDRIDRLADGSLLIIDYKTGIVKNLLSRDGSPAELQVVVYATALEEAVGGLALFNIGSRAIQHKGVGGSVEWNTMSGEEWEETLQQWKSIVHSAMERIAAPDVRLNLKLSTAQSRPLNVLSRAEEQKRAV